MASSALEAIVHFITARKLREGETFSFASLQIRHPNHDELAAALDEMGKEGLIENMSDGTFKLTKTGSMKFFGESPSEEDAIKAIMSEIATRGIKAGKSFLWTPMQKQLELNRFREGDLKPALEKIFNNRWLENAPAPGFFKLTQAGFEALKTMP
jgi:hypothetical protein